MKWIYHEHEARVICSLTTDRKPVIDWAKIHLLHIARFISILAKRQVYPFDDR